MQSTHFKGNFKEMYVRIVFEMIRHRTTPKALIISKILTFLHGIFLTFYFPMSGYQKG